jgi:nicotinamide-nucleotide amidase
MRDLKVAAATLEGFGAVSEQTVREMAEGALRATGANVALAVSGIAGPEGGTPEKPVGTVWFCGAARQGAATDVIAESERFSGERALVRSRAVQHALRLILRLDLPVHLESTPRPGPP